MSFAGTDMQYNDGQGLVDSPLAASGIARANVRITGHDTARFDIDTKSGFLGWYARRYLRRHPVTFKWQAKAVGEDWQWHSAEVFLDGQPLT